MSISQIRRRLAAVLEQALLGAAMNVALTIVEWRLRLRAARQKSSA